MENDAAQQLALIADARARLADRVPTPWWFHVSLGIVVGAMIAVLALGTGKPWGLPTVAGLGAAELLVFVVYRNRLGVWSTSWEGYPRAFLWGLGAALAALAVAACVVAARTDLTWPVLLLAACASVTYVVCGRLADARWLAHLRRETP